MGWILIFFYELIDRIKKIFIGMVKTRPHEFMGDCNYLIHFNYILSDDLGMDDDDDDMDGDGMMDLDWGDDEDGGGGGEYGRID